MFFLNEVKWLNNTAVAAALYIADTQEYSARSRTSEEPWRSHSTAIWRDWNAQHNRIATHYCRTLRFDAPVPMHKVSHHMQSTKAQHQQRREKVTWNRQLHCANMSSKIPRQSDDA